MTCFGDLLLSVTQDLWDAGSTQDLLALALASKLDIGKILDDVVGPPATAASPLAVAAGSPASPVAAAGSPVPSSSPSPPKPTSILEANERALSYNLGGSRVYQESAKQEEKAKAEARAREEAARKAATRQAAIDAQGGIDATIEAVVAKRKAAED